MALNTVNNTNLLSKYTASSSPSKLQSTTLKPDVAKTPSKDELILKQKQLIKLQKQELENLRNNRKAESGGGGKIITGLLMGLGAIYIFDAFMTGRLLRRQPDITEMMSQMNKELEKSFRAMAEADGDAIIPQAVNKSKKIIRAIINSAGKVIGKTVTDRKTGRVLKNIEFYQGTQKPCTVEVFDYNNNRKYYKWLRENGTKMWEEIFDLKTDKKLSTYFYSEDGKNIEKIVRGK